MFWLRATAHPDPNIRKRNHATPASGAQAGRLFTGCGQERAPVPIAQLTRRGWSFFLEEGMEGGERRSPTRLSLIGQRSAGGSSRVGDCAKELTLPMHPSVCFEASRLTLTQSSWPAPRRGCSRPWRSGYAASPLAGPSDRGPQTTWLIGTPGDPHPASEGEPPFPLDSYLSWMSPHFP